MEVEVDVHDELVLFFLLLLPLPLPLLVLVVLVDHLAAETPDWCNLFCTICLVRENFCPPGDWIKIWPQ